MASLQSFYVAVDGSQFATEAEADAYQLALDNADVIDAYAEEFVNVTAAPGAKVPGLVGRTRVFNKNVCAQAVTFLMSKGVALDMEFVAAAPSEELQVRLDAEAVKVAEAKATAEAKKAEKDGKVEVSAEDEEKAAEDLFAAE